MKKISVILLALLFCLGLSLAGFGCSKEDANATNSASPNPNAKVSNGGNSTAATIEPTKPEGKSQP